MKFMPHNGYAPGNYMNVCSACGHTSLACDKRAYVCISCAFGGTVPVFVFGSNLAGRHGKGAALFAQNARGARYGVGEGYMGNSYALPTKDGALRTLALDEIERHVANFLAFARCHRELMFQVTAIGCGLAGYSPAEIAPLFEHAPDNCVLPFEFKGIIG